MKFDQLFATLLMTVEIIEETKNQTKYHFIFFRMRETNFILHDHFNKTVRGL